MNKSIKKLVLLLLTIIPCIPFFGYAMDNQIVLPIKKRPPRTNIVLPPKKRKLNEEQMQYSQTTYSVENTQTLLNIIERISLENQLNNIRAILDQQEKLNRRDQYGNTQLHSAIAHNQLHDAQTLLDQGADINAMVDSPYQLGVTPLYIAVDMNNINALELLLRYKPNVDLARCNNGWTPLHRAISHNNISMVKMLLSHGAQTENKITKGNLLGATPLHIAVQNNNSIIVSLLINAGANINAQMENGTTSLHLAAQKGYVTIVETLLKAHADLNIQDKMGNTPFHWAALNDHKKIMQKLILTKRLKLDAKNKSGQTAFDLTQYSIQKKPTQRRVQLGLVTLIRPVDSSVIIDQ